MPRDARYYADWTTPATGVRWRLIFTPRQAVIVDVDGVITAGALDWEPVPEFGSPRIDGSGWIPLPEGTIYSPKMPEFGFDELPVGHIDPPSLSLTVKTLFLDGDEDLEDIVTYIADPAWDVTTTDRVGSSLDVGASGVEVVPGEWRPVNTTNLWHLTTDDGDGELEVGAFRVAGIFGHERNLAQTHVVNEATGAVEISLTLVHVFWLVASQVFPDDVAARVGEFRSEVVAPYLYDLAWRGATHGYARVLGSHPALQATDGHPDEHWMYPVSDVTAEIATLLQRTFSAFTRAPGTNVSLGSPIDALALRKQSQTVANTAGAAIDAPYICGYIKDRDTGDVRGGFLSVVGGEEGTLFQWETIDRLLFEITEGCVQKGEALAFDPLTLDISNWGITESAVELAITTAVGATEQPRWSGRTLEIGAGALSGADAEIPGAQDGDVTSIEYRLGNVREHNNRTVPVVLHCQPHVGPRAAEWLGVLSQGSSDWQCIGNSLITMNCLWYMGQLEVGGVGVGSAVPIRVHHYIGITDGATTYNEVTNGIELPDPGALPGVSGGVVVGPADQNLWFRFLWDPTRRAMIRMQKQGGIPFAACVRMARRFGDRLQTAYPGTYAATDAGAEQLGRRAGTAWVSGSTLTGKAYHLQSPGRPILVRTSLDEATGKASVRLLGVGGT